MRLYIAGPMTGLPDFNYPAFNAAAAQLRSLGYEVENPAENPEQASWGAYMRLSLTQLLKCDAMVLLPGWNNSRGAGLEVNVAAELGMKQIPLANIEAFTREREAVA